MAALPAPGVTTLPVPGRAREYKGVMRVKRRRNSTGASKRIKRSLKQAASEMKEEGEENAAVPVPSIVAPNATSAAATNETTAAVTMAALEAPIPQNKTRLLISQVDTAIGVEGYPWSLGGPLYDSPADVKEDKEIAVGSLIHDFLRPALVSYGWTEKKTMSDLNVDGRLLLVAYKRIDRAHAHLKCWNRRVRHGFPYETMHCDVESIMQDTYDRRAAGGRYQI